MKVFGELFAAEEFEEFVNDLEVRRLKKKRFDKLFEELFPCLLEDPVREQKNLSEQRKNWVLGCSRSFFQGCR